MDLIQLVLELVKAKLDAFLGEAHEGHEGWVVLSNLVDHEGHPADGTKDKLVMYLANIQHETVIGTPGRTAVMGSGQYSIVAPPLYINLWLLIVANFSGKNYPDGLAMISRAIAFLHQNSYFTRENSPTLPAGIEKLALEMVNLDFTELNYLFGVSGAKYLPSVCYKIRLIPFRSDAVEGVLPTVKGLRAPQAE